MRKTALVASLSLTLASGCALLPQKRAEVVTPAPLKGKGALLTLPAQLRIYSVHARNSGDTASAEFVSCSEPMPDVAMSETFHLVNKLVGKASKPVAGASTAASAEASMDSDLATTANALELAGRTHVVLLAREMLFRLCEARANGWLTSAELVAAQKAVISEISAMSQAEKDRAKADSAKAEAAVLKLKNEALDRASEAVKEATKSK